MSVPRLIERRATLVTLVAGTTETRVGRWAALTGEDEMLPLALDTRCNWPFAVSGVENEHTLLDASIDLLQREHPCVGMDANPGGLAPGPGGFIARRRA